MDICGNENIGFDIIAANVGKQKNRKSIVLRVSTEKSMLLAGDMERSAAKTVTKASHNRLKSDIYQIYQIYIKYLITERALWPTNLNG